MMRIQPVTASEPRSEFEAAEQRYGWLPTTIRVMARGTDAAELYLSAGSSNAKGSLSRLARELIAVEVARVNSCEYCHAAHTVAARSLGDPDAMDRAALDVARRMLRSRGALTDEELDEARDHGVDDRMLIDIACVIAENTLGNLVNNLARTELDSVLVRALERTTT